MKTTKKKSTFRKLAEYANAEETPMVAVNLQLPKDVMDLIKEIQEAAASETMGRPSQPEVITGVFMEVAPFQIREYIADLKTKRAREIEEKEALDAAESLSGRNVGTYMPAQD